MPILSSVCSAFSEYLDLTICDPMRSLYHRYISARHDRHLFDDSNAGHQSFFDTMHKQQALCSKDIEFELVEDVCESMRAIREKFTHGAPPPPIPLRKKRPSVH